MSAKRGDTVTVQGLGVGMRVVHVHDGQALLSHEPFVSAEENREREAKGLRQLLARVRYEVAPLALCLRA
jgi:hypothetical protein